MTALKEKADSIKKLKIKLFTSLPVPAELKPPAHRRRT